jgi:hypothetical protein
MRNKLLFYAFTLLLLFGCKKQCTEANFVYDADINVTPAKNIFKLGDTISFKYKINKCGFELIRQQNICIEDINLPTIVLRVLKYDSIELVNNRVLRDTGAIAKFKWVISNGSITNIQPENNRRLIRLTFSETTNTIELNFSLISSERGFYRLGSTTINALNKHMPCRMTTARADAIWPTHQITEMLGINNWQNIQEMQKGFFNFKII